MRVLSWDELGPEFQKAVRQATEAAQDRLKKFVINEPWRSNIAQWVRHPEKFFYREQTVRTQVLVSAFERGGWSERTLDADDKRRIKHIIQTKTSWPYVNFVGTAFAEWKESLPDDHGDGYHRVWAAYFNEEPTMLFLTVIYPR